MKGILLAFQFFTVIPINRQLPMEKKQVTTMFCALPFIGALLGVIASALYYILQTYAGFSPLFTSFLVLGVFIVMTGGLHIDGLVDVGDAFFSYRNVEQRHEILKDPRIGAFGAMTLVFFVLAKLLLFYELIVADVLTAGWLIFIPFLSRLGMGVYLVQTPTSKETGLGAFFKAHIHLKLFLIITVICLIAGTLLIGFISGEMLVAFILMAVTIGLTFVYRRWTMKNFNGSSGDLYGAFIEGSEVILWFLLLLCV